MDALCIVSIRKSLIRPNRLKLASLILLLKDKNSLLGSKLFLIKVNPLCTREVKTFSRKFHPMQLHMFPLKRYHPAGWSLSQSNGNKCFWI